MSKITFIGYRIKDMGGFQGNSLQTAIQSKIDDLIGQLNPKEDVIYTGLGLGIDQWVAQSAIKHGIPYIAYLAYETQESRWLTTTKLEYKTYLKNAQEIIYTDRGDFDVKKLIARDNKVAELADTIYSFFNGDHIALRLPKKLGKNIINAMPEPEHDDHFIGI